MSEGQKLDSGKIQVELLDAEWLEGVGRVLTFGAKKYAAENWRKGLSIKRTIGATLRHIFAFMRGEDIDAESGCHHLLCASCELMFTFWMVIHRKDLDDRFKAMPQDYECEEYYCEGCSWRFTARREAMPNCPECKTSKQVHRFHWAKQ